MVEAVINVLYRKCKGEIRMSDDINALKAENAQLKEDCIGLTKICCCLHKRLGGGQVVIEAAYLNMFTGEEDISCLARSSGKGYVVEITRK